MCRRSGDVLVDALRDDGLLELARRIQLEERTGGKRKRHAFVVCLQVVVDLREDKGRKLTFGKAFVFVECLTVSCLKTG